jgi:hypothetical protein
MYPFAQWVLIDIRHHEEHESAAARFAPGHEDRMLAWMKKRSSTAPNTPEPATDPAESRRSAMSGKYVSLFKYLNGRYANVVVLTFAEIEDLLGFSLPDLARLSEEWWTDPDRNATHPRFSDAWLLANRTARPNLPALTVVFARPS